MKDTHFGNELTQAVPSFITKYVAAIHRATSLQLISRSQTKRFSWNSGSRFLRAVVSRTLVAIVAMSAIGFAQSASAAASLAVGISGTHDAVKPGEQILFRVTVSNTGNSASGSFFTTVTIPAHTTSSYAAAAPTLWSSTCTSQGNCQPGQTLIWSVGSLAPGASSTMQFSATVDVSNPPTDGTVTSSTATATLGIVNISATSQVVIDSRAQPIVDLTDNPSVVAPSGMLTYVLNFGNPSNSAVNATLRLPIPAGTTFISASNGGTFSSGVVTWNLASLAAGATGQRQVILQVNSTTIDGTQLAANADLYDASSLQSYSRAGRISTISTPSTPALLAMSMTATPNPVLPGQQVLYKITVSNLGSAASGSFYTTVTIPAHMTSSYSAVAPTLWGSTCTSSGNCQPGQNLIWSVGSLAPGASSTMQFSATVDVSNPPPNGSLITTAATTSFVGTIGTASATQNVTVTSAPILALDVTDSPSIVASNGTLTYVLNFGNPSNSAVNATLRLPIPAGTTFISASNGGTLSNGVVTWNLASLAAGATGQRQVILQVNSTTIDGTQLAANTDLYDTSSLQSYSRAGRTSTVHTPSATSPLLTMSMTAIPNPVLPGQQVLYKITVSNLGGAPSGSFYTTVTIPAHMTSSYSAAAPTLWGSTCTSSGNCQPGQTLIWSVGSLAPGASSTMQFSATVDSSNPPPNGSLLTTAATTSFVGTIGNASATQNVTVSAAPILLLDLTANPSVVAPNGTLTYVLNFGNPSSSAINATLRLPIPAGTTFISASNGGTLSNGAVTWNLASLAAGATGQRQVVLQVNSTTIDGTQLAANADLYDTSSLQSYSRAGCISSVNTPSTTPLLAMSMTVTPNPVLPGRQVLYKITVSNLGGAPSGSFFTTVTIPAHTTSSYAAAAPTLWGSTCTSSGNCQPGQTLIWSVASLAPGASSTMQFSATVDSSNPPPNGSLITTAATTSFVGTIGTASANQGNGVGQNNLFDGIVVASASTDADAPLPLWSLFALAASLIGAIKRREC